MSKKADEPLLSQEEGKGVVNAGRPNDSERTAGRTYGEHNSIFHERYPRPLVFERHLE